VARRTLSGAKPQAIATGPSVVQGDKVAQQRAQKAMPLPRAPGLPAPSGPSPFSPRPNEPVQAGLPLGPGSGASPLMGIDPADVTLSKLQAVASASNNPELASLVAEMVARRAQGL